MYNPAHFIGTETVLIGYMAPLSLIVTNGGRDGRADGRTDVWTDGRTAGRMDRHFSHMLIGHLLQSKDDLKRLLLHHGFSHLQIC